MTATQAETETVPLGWVVRSLGKSPEKTREALREGAGFEYESNSNSRKSINIPLLVAIKAAAWQDETAGELTPADQRNMAQAEKLREETAIMKRQNIPIEEAAEVHERILGALLKWVETFDDNEQRAAVIDGIHAACPELK